MNPDKSENSVVTRIEHLSFEISGTYMDVELRYGYVDITIGGVENEKFSVTLEQWQEINAEIVKMLNQK